MRGSAVVPGAGRHPAANRTMRRISRIYLLTPGVAAHPIPELIVGTRLVGGGERGVQIARHRSREAGDNLLAGDEPVPLVIGGRASRICVASPISAATRQNAALIGRPVDGDGLAGDVALFVQIVPGNRDQDVPVADQEGLAAVLDLVPLELVGVRCRGAAECVVCHAPAHLRDVADAAAAIRLHVRTPGLCGPFQYRTVVVKSAELDEAEILRHKVALLPL